MLCWAPLGTQHTPCHCLCGASCSPADRVRQRGRGGEARRRRGRRGGGGRGERGENRVGGEGGKVVNIHNTVLQVPRVQTEETTVMAFHNGTRQPAQRHFTCSQD